MRVAQLESFVCQANRASHPVILVKSPFPIMACTSRITSTSSVVVFHECAHEEHHDRCSDELKQWSHPALRKMYHRCIQHVLDAVQMRVELVIKFSLWVISLTSQGISVPMIWLMIQNLFESVWEISKPQTLIDSGMSVFSWFPWDMGLCQTSLNTLALSRAFAFPLIAHSAVALGGSSGQKKRVIKLNG